jgi:endonuclease I/V8-like Glu-specific endopeptidase
MIDMKVIEETEQRFKERTDARNETLKRIDTRPLAEVDSPERVAKRIDRLKEHFMSARAFTPAEVTAVTFDDGAVGGEDIEDILRERVLGKTDLLGVNYLSHGNTVARAICRVRIRNEQKRVIGFGTGFMISPRLVITNNHVLHDIGEAKNSQVEFNFQDDDDNRPMQPILFDLDPDMFFVTNEHLDYSVVAVRDNSQGLPLSSFGRLRMIEEEGKIVLGEPASIIQHPNGGAKQLALRENKIVDRLEEFLQYMTDTAPGSSGSAVFNDQWEVIALHHSGVPNRDGEGRILAVDGSVWKKEMGETKIAWKANEGVRVSRIIADLKAQNLTNAQSQLLAEILNATTLPQPESQPRVSGALPTRSAQREGAYSGVFASDVDKDSVAAGTATWTIPLTVSVQLGVPVMPSSAASGVHSIANNALNNSDIPHAAVGGNAELNASLATLRETLSKKYYDPDQDGQDRDTYYKDLNKALSPTAIFDALHELLENTHKTPHSYKPSKYVYPVVDLQPNGKLRSIYSGVEFDPQEFIREDIRIEQERASRLYELMTREGKSGGGGFLEVLDLLEAQQPYNCEHSVCQSWFGKEEPMRGDLHHLFACESRCNSFRNDIPYFDFPDFGETVREDCGKQEDKARFEPSAGKGKVARATLYFLLRYPGLINKIEQHYDEDGLNTLLNWHDEFPVAPHELHRNASIYALQGNRNPLIDFPKLAKKIDFTGGL